MKVYLIQTGVANVASVAAAFVRLGAEVELTSDPATVASAPAVVLPGVGAFGAGMASLCNQGLDRALSQRIAAGRPTLAVCLGLQLLCTGSDEAPGVRGLGALPAAARRLPDAQRLPHFGWNRVKASPPSGRQPRFFVEDGDAYFAHTYCLNDTAALEAAGWSIATTEEGSLFVSAVERGAVLACQFHPELSGSYGAALLQRWLEQAAAESPSATPAATW